MIQLLTAPPKPWSRSTSIVHTELLRYARAHKSLLTLLPTEVPITRSAILQYLNTQLAVTGDIVAWVAPTVLVVRAELSLDRMLDSSPVKIHGSNRLIPSLVVVRPSHESRQIICNASQVAELTTYEESCCAVPLLRVPPGSSLLSLELSSTSFGADLAELDPEIQADCALALLGRPASYEKELVSCLMVTRERLPLVQRAVRCFLQQSYLNRELIVVDDAEDGVKEYISSLRDPRISFVSPEASNMTLGELRNEALLVACGRIVFQWDDDDWYHPDRIKIQVAAMRYTGARVCFLNRWTLFWPERKLAAYSKRRLWEGSMAAFKDGLPSYRGFPRGEDSDLVARILEAGNVSICSIDNPDLYVYVVHGKNTYGQEHFQNSIFDETTHLFDKKQFAAVAAKLDGQ